MRIDGAWNFKNEKRSSSPPSGDRRLLKSILANTPIYRSLDDEQLELLAATSRSMRVSGNSPVVEQGEQPKGVYVVVFGQARIGFDRDGGGEKTVAILGQSQCFGLAETVLNRPHLASVKTIADSMIVHTPREKVFELARENFSFAQDLMACIGRQVHCLMRDVERYALDSAKQRLADHLLRQSERQGADTIQLIASKTLIASRLSISGETLSRLLQEFSAQEMICMNGRRIKIVNRRKLAALLVN